MKSNDQISLGSSGAFSGRTSLRPSFGSPWKIEPHLTIYSPDPLVIPGMTIPSQPVMTFPESPMAMLPYKRALIASTTGASRIADLFSSR
jgi:hypothetical protein